VVGLVGLVVFGLVGLVGLVVFGLVGFGVVGLVGLVGLVAFGVVALVGLVVFGFVGFLLGLVCFNVVTGFVGIHVGWVDKSSEISSNIYIQCPNSTIIFLLLHTIFA
jgi:hypothetical protein